MTDFDDATLASFLDLAFDFLCERRVNEFVDVTKILPALDIAVTPERLTRAHERFVAPSRLRLIERASKSTEKLGAWLPDDVRDRIATMLGAPVRLPRRAIDNAVASEQVRDGVKNTLQETLTNFLKGGTGGAVGGLGAAVGMGARAFGSMTKGLLGGIGEGLQQQLQDRVTSFVDASVATVQKRIAERIASDEVARTLGQRRKKMFLGLLDKTDADAAKTMMRVPYGEIDPMLPKIAVHNLARAAVREAIEAEVRATLAELSKQTVGELLDEAGLRAMAREAVHAQGLPLARAFVGTRGFAGWWGKLM
jgi:histone H3/H4